MKISKINLNNIQYNSCEKKQYINTSQKDVFLSSDKVKNVKTKGVSFSGFFFKTNDKLKNISAGSDVILKQGQIVSVPDEAFTIRFKSGDRIDLNSCDYSKKIASLQEGENITFSSSNDEQVILFKKDGNIQLKNNTKGDISLFSDSYFKNYDENVLKSKFSSSRTSFSQLLIEKYNEIRRTKYEEQTTFPCGMSSIYQVSQKDKPNLFVMCSHGWFFRMPTSKISKAASSDTKPQRISLNVVANPAVVDELDELLLNGTYTDSKNNVHKINKSKLEGINYKVPSKPESWLKRHDPITIYNNGSFSSEVIDAISTISEKYKRESSNGIPLVGALNNKPWIALEPDYKEEDFLEIKKEAEKYSSELADAMCQSVYKKYNHERGYCDFSASTGTINSCRFILDEYIEFLKHYNN